MPGPRVARLRSLGYAPFVVESNWYLRERAPYRLNFTHCCPDRNDWAFIGSHSEAGDPCHKCGEPLPMTLYVYGRLYTVDMVYNSQTFGRLILTLERHN